MQFHVDHFTCKQASPIKRYRQVDVLWSTQVHSSSAGCRRTKKRLRLPQSPPAASRRAFATGSRGPFTPVQRSDLSAASPSATRRELPSLPMPVLVVLRRQSLPVSTVVRRCRRSHRGHGLPGRHHATWPRRRLGTACRQARRCQRHRRTSSRTAGVPAADEKSGDKDQHSAGQGVEQDGLQ
jgi:hypothetical protein